MTKAWAGGGDYYENDAAQMVAQKIATKVVLISLSNVRLSSISLNLRLNRKLKDTIIFLGDNWGYGTLIVALLAGGFT